MTDSLLAGGSTSLETLHRNTTKSVECMVGATWRRRPSNEHAAGRDDEPHAITDRCCTKFGRSDKECVSPFTSRVECSSHDDAASSARNGRSRTSSSSSRRSESSDTLCVVDDKECASAIGQGNARRGVLGKDNRRASARYRRRGVTCGIRTRDFVLGRDNRRSSARTTRTR